MSTEFHPYMIWKSDRDQSGSISSVDQAAQPRNMRLCAFGRGREMI